MSAIVLYLVGVCTSVGVMINGGKVGGAIVLTLIRATIGVVFIAFIVTRQPPMMLLI